MLWGTFVGLIFIMVFYNFILYVGVKDVVYLYYVGYMISILTEMGLLHGFIALIYPKPVTFFITENITVIHYCVVFFALNFALKYLRFDQDANRIYKFGRWVTFLLIPFAVSAPFMKEYESAQLYFVIQGFCYVFILYLLSKKIRANFSWAKYYFISWFPVYVGAAVTPALLLGMVEYSFWVRNAMLISVMIEATLIAMALASRLRSTEAKVLYSTTHDQIFDLANKSLLTSSIGEQIRRNTRGYSYTILVAEIKQFHVFSPYLTAEQLIQLTYKTASVIEESFAQLPLLVLDSNKGDLKHAFVFKDGIIGIAVESTEMEEIHEVLNKAETAFPVHFESPTMNVSINCVFGLATSTDAPHPEQVASKALQVINSVKKKSLFYGQYNATAEDKELRKIYLVAELKKAIEENQLQLYFQPQVILESARPCGGEALLRWDHPTLGFIPPDEFIPIAEDTGLIEHLTRWVITKGFEAQVELKSRGHELTLSLNVSTLDIISKPMCQFVIDMAEKLDIDAKRIILEVTETASIFDQENFEINLNQLSNAGFKIAIDDFGTGYSSLSYLSSYPIYELKIDKSLIFNLATSKKDELIIKATLSMAESLNMLVVAEGIENKLASEKLASFNCAVAQGYYFAKPMPLENYVEWLVMKGKGD